MNSISSDVVINIPTGADQLLRVLQEEGFDAFVVGGCVRDGLLGITPHDWDITTSATPEEVHSVLSSFSIYDTGIKHGTVSVRASDGELYEVTTFRMDGEYLDNRHPESVSFVRDIVKDLARRDFTVNAMAYSPKTGLIDPFGGRSDLENNILRCVGNPDKRFNEDGLRILRALRFASVYCFDIEADTAVSLIKNRALLNNISAERVSSELVKLLCGDRAFKILVGYKDVILQIIPELWPCVHFAQHSKWHDYSVYTHIAHSVAAYQGDDPVIKLTMLLHDIAKPDCFVLDEQGRGHFPYHAENGEKIAYDILTRLKFDSYTRDTVCQLIRLHDRQIDPTRRACRRLLNQTGADLAYKLLEVKKADTLAQSEYAKDQKIPEFKKVRELIGDILSAGNCFSIKDLQINGSDLISELGMAPGKEIGVVLQKLLDGVIDEKVENAHDALLSEAEKIIGVDSVSGTNNL